MIDDTVMEAIELMAASSDVAAEKAGMEKLALMLGDLDTNAFASMTDEEKKEFINEFL